MNSDSQFWILRELSLRASKTKGSRKCSTGIVHRKRDALFAERLAQKLRSSDFHKAVIAYDLALIDSLSSASLSTLEKFGKLSNCDLIIQVVGAEGLSLEAIKIFREGSLTAESDLVLLKPDAPQAVLTELRGVNAPIARVESEDPLTFVREGALSLSYIAGSSVIKVPSLRIKLASLAEQLAASVRSDPSALMKLNPRQFEELVAGLMARNGYEVTLTQTSHDRGVDIYAVKSDDYGRFLTIVDCKHYRANRPVQIEIIRTMRGTLDFEKASHAIIATTSRFTPGARELEREYRFLMSLRDHQDICRWIKLSFPAKTT